MVEYILPLLKYAAGPVLIWVLRNVAPGFIAKLPASLQAIGAAVINVILAIATGVDPVLSLAALIEAIKVFFATGGLVKFGIDFPQGKTRTVTSAEKAILDNVVSERG